LGVLAMEQVARVGSAQDSLQDAEGEFAGRSDHSSCSQSVLEGGTFGPMRAALGLAFLVTSTALAEHAPMVWEFPALSVGPQRWSRLSLTNSGDSPETVHLEAHCGIDPLPLTPEITLPPRQSRELRIDDPAAKGKTLCWARVETPGDTPVRAE